jgi:hypothetical protein
MSKFVLKNSNYTTSGTKVGSHLTPSPPPPHSARVGAQAFCILGLTRPLWPGVSAVVAFLSTLCASQSQIKKNSLRLCFPASRRRLSLAAVRPRRPLGARSRLTGDWRPYPALAGLPPRPTALPWIDSPPPVRSRRGLIPSRASTAAQVMFDLSPAFLIFQSHRVDNRRQIPFSFEPLFACAQVGAEFKDK